MCTIEHAINIHKENGKCNKIKRKKNMYVLCIHIFSNLVYASLAVDLGHVVAINELELIRQGAFGCNTKIKLESHHTHSANHPHPPKKRRKR